MMLTKPQAERLVSALAKLQAGAVRLEQDAAHLRSALLAEGGGEDAGLNHAQHLAESLVVCLERSIQRWDDERSEPQPIVHGS
jgi:hypothetical protein